MVIQILQNLQKYAAKIGNWRETEVKAYEAVSNYGPVWVRSEDKIPSGFESTPNIIF